MRASTAFPVLRAARTQPPGWWRGPATAVAVVAASLVVGVAASRAPVLAVGMLVAGIAWLLLGPESWIAVAWLLAFGLFPFVSPDLAVGGMPVWLLTGGGALALMVLVWGFRTLAGRTLWPQHVPAVIVAVLVLLVYVLLRALATAPMEVPTMTAAYIVFPIAALVSYLWFLQVPGAARIKVLVGIVGVAGAAWALAYVAASAGGCGPCRSYVSMIYEEPGLLGFASRIWTNGQAAFVGLTVLLIGRTIGRPSLPLVALSGLAVVTVILQGSRAVYFAVVAGVLLLLLLRFRRGTATTRVLVVALAVIAAVAFATSPVGDRLVSGYVELRAQSGNGGFRLVLINRSAEHWGWIGEGFSNHSRLLGVTFDLGIPNTILLLGYVGAALQILVVLLAIGQGLRSSSLWGSALAALFVTVLVARPSLPFLETGSGAAAFGLAVGATAALVPRLDRHRAVP